MLIRFLYLRTAFGIYPAISAIVIGDKLLKRCCYIRSLHSVERAGDIVRAGGGVLETAICQRKRRRVATPRMDQSYIVPTSILLIWDVF